MNGSAFKIIPRYGTTEENVGVTSEVKAIAGEDLSPCDCVFLAPADSASLTPGRVYKMSASKGVTSTSAFFIGFVTTGATTGNQCVVQAEGVVKGFLGLVPGALQYVSDVAGQVTSTAPMNAVLVGMAIGTDGVMINQRRGNSGGISAI